MLSSGRMQTVSRLRCETCGKTFEISRKVPWCECGGLFDLDMSLPDRLEIDAGDFTFWRYQGVLPVRAKISLGEPITPVVPLEIQKRTVDVKLEYLMPTGSFKDRGAAVLVSALVDAGIDRFM